MVQRSLLRVAPSMAWYRQATRPIDMPHLVKQTLGDPGLEQEVLRMYGVMVRTYLERLESSTTRDELTRHLHTMKGASLGVGAWSLVELCKTAESELRSGRPVNPERIADIAMAVGEVTAFIGGVLREDDDEGAAYG
jgi:HPt (histidine-containing phosphotransfer) domain-containing protein